MTPNTEGLLAGFKAYERGVSARRDKAIGPMMTRQNVDNTWRVVQDGQTLAGGFDNATEAEAWIKEQGQ